MSLTLVETAGSATANTYCTLAEALAYGETVFPATEAEPFAEAAPDDQKRALLAATVALDQLRARLAGLRATSTQALEYPRSGILKPDRSTYYDTTEIPASVKQAEARLAMYLVKQGKANALDGGFTTTPGLTSISLGSELSMSFDGVESGVSDSQRFLASVIFPILGNLVRAGQPRLVRG